MKIFSGNANRVLAKEIAEVLSLPLSPTEIRVFPDGERRIQLQESVVSEDVVIVEPTSPPVDTHLVELLLLIDAAKRSGAKSVTAVIPYLGYQRQDHIFRDGEAVSLDVVRKIIETIGVDKVVILDGHSVRVPELFSVPVLHLSALQLFAKEIEKMGWKNEDSVLVSPDMGGIRRITMLSGMLGNMPYIAIDKNRDLESGEISSNTFTGTVRKRALIVDDMISSGKTIVAAASLLAKNGVSESIVFATHPVFSDHAPDVLEHSLVSKVYVTNTIAISERKQFAKLEILSVAKVIASSLLAASL